MKKQVTFSAIIAPDQSFVYQTVLSVKTTDINDGNHLAAIAIPPILQQVRMQFLKTHGYSEVNIAGIGWIMADLYVHYESESFLADQLLIRLGIETLTAHSAILVYHLHNQTQKKSMAIAKEKLIFFDYQKRKVAKTPTFFLRIATPKNVTLPF